MKTCPICNIVVTNKRYNFCSQNCYHISLLKTNKIIYQDSEKTIIDVSTEKYKNMQCIVDTFICTKEFFNNGRWMVDTNREQFYAKKNIRVSTGKQIRLKLHRYVVNAKKGDHVDHINCNTLDNRKSNLRICTLAENSRNISKKINNNSGYKGVCYNKRCKKYVSYITLNKKRFHLGYFDDPKDGAIAYNKACLELHGEFARINKNV